MRVFLNLFIKRDDAARRRLLESACQGRLLMYEEPTMPQHRGEGSKTVLSHCFQLKMQREIRGFFSISS